MNSLTRLTLTYLTEVNWASVAIFLQGSTSLEWLALNLQSILPDSDPSTQPIPLPRLVYLSIPDFPFNRYIWAPQLQGLGCEDYLGKMTTISPSTQLHVKHLMLHAHYKTVLQGWRPPSWLASIESLELAGRGTAEYILGALCPSDDGEDHPGIFPLLSTLRLYESPVAPEAYDQFCNHLLQLLDSRPELYIEFGVGVLYLSKLKQESLESKYKGRLLLATGVVWRGWQYSTASGEQFGVRI